MKDSIYAKPLNEVELFRFDDQVAVVFSDMIERSVPGYQTIITSIGLLASRFARPNSVCYDLGCSLGAATLSMCQQVNSPTCRVIAVDNSEAMIERFKASLAGNKFKQKIDIVCSDIRNVVIENAAVVVINFTLQFLPIEDRLMLLKSVWNGLLPGGALILSEKIHFQDIRQQELHTEMHYSFKKAQGYSELEISQKRTALENVLISETLNQHQTRISKAGFSSSEVWFQYFNFASIIALK